MPAALPEEIYSAIIAFCADDSPRQKSHYSPILNSKKSDRPNKLLEWKDFYRTLSTLCLVSKAFCRISRPQLYRTYVRSESNARLFLRTLLEHPKTTQLVKELGLQSWILPTYNDSSTEPQFDDVERIDPVSGEMIDLYEKAVPTLGPFEITQGTLRYLKEGRADFEIGLLVALCTGIETLEIVPSCYFGQQPIGGQSNLLAWVRSHWEVDSKLPIRSRVFQNLRSLHIQQDDGGSIIIDWLLFEFLRIPTLKSFFVVRGTADEFDFPSSLRHHSLAHIHLRNYEFWMMKDIEQMLRTCTLETFEIQVTGVTIADQFSLENLGNLIRLHCPSLKRLSIEPQGLEHLFTNLARGTSRPFFDDTLKLGSLKSLQRLEYLRAPVKQLVHDVEDGEHHFESIERYNEIYDQLVSFVLPPSIKEVVLLGYFDHNSGSSTNAKMCEVKYTGESNGSIGFEMHQCAKDAESDNQHRCVFEVTANNE